MATIRPSKPPFWEDITMKPTFMIAAASFLLSVPAYAGDTYIAVLPQAAPASAQPGSYFLKNAEVIQNPMDAGDINQSPIRGKGAFKVVHNEPAADATDTEVNKAIRVLKDNGWKF